VIMPRMSSAEYQAYQMRHRDASEGDQELRREAGKRDPEKTLHDEIIAHCDKQWPRWKYIHSRMDKPSTIQEGCQDFTIFMPGRVLCVECKRVGGKLSLEQNIWIAEMKQVGVTVHVIETFEEFLKLTKEPK
jgi:hypothetical protein